MSRENNGVSDFERRLRDLLAQSVQRVDGRARSRLNQARHAALAEAARQRRWRLPRRLAARIGWPPLWMPAAAAAAALCVAFVLWPHASPGYPAVDASHAEDLALLADRDGMDLMRDGDGQFYEWAMAQADKGGEPAVSGAVGHRGQPSGGATGRNSG